MKFSIPIVQCINFIFTVNTLCFSHSLFSLAGHVLAFLILYLHSLLIYTSLLSSDLISAFVYFPFCHISAMVHSSAFLCTGTAYTCCVISLRKCHLSCKFFFHLKLFSHTKFLNSGCRRIDCIFQFSVIPFLLAKHFFSLWSPLLKLLSALTFLTTGKTQARKNITPSCFFHFCVK